MGSKVDVTVQFIEGRPNWQTALHRIRLAANEIGVRVWVSTVAVETQHEAEMLGFAGSPTILVDGRDPFGTPGAAPALACRVYNTPDGRAGAPSVEQIVQALCGGVGSSGARMAGRALTPRAACLASG